MESKDYQIEGQSDFSCLNLDLKKSRFSGLLLILTIVISGKILLYTTPSLAQNTITQSRTQVKNIIYVNPKTGNDAQAGQKFMPLKTITQALKIATPGTKIQLASGTYSEETGESFPLIIKDKIVLQGNPRNQGYEIVIQGGGDFISPTGAGQNVAIAALKDADGIVGVTVINDHSRGHGVWIESSSPKVASNTFTRNGNTGVSVNGSGAPIIENNYFYNNSGNGLLIYGAAQPQVVENTFEQTGFGVSLVQKATATVSRNYFKSNRIGIILEGESQATLRDNEIINSWESGLTAIAQSQVDLGTNDEPGDNIFRSNQKLDIQNVTSNEIVAVGTETSGNTEGAINFEQGELIPQSNRERDLPPVPAPLADQDSTNEPSIEQISTLALPELPPTVDDDTAALPSPPPLPEESKTNNKELIFTASSTTIPQDIEPEPVPFLPQISNSALSGNNSQVSSLSDVLGSSASAEVKYKVLVEAEDADSQAEVRSLYPQAFATIYQGKSVLQVGAFNNWDKAKQAEQSLTDLGLDTYLLE